MFLLDVVAIDDIRERDKRYFENNIKCPFLLKSECSIYSVRPIVCRAFFSTAPRQLCLKNILNSESQLIKDRKLKDMKNLHMKLIPEVPYVPVLLPGYLKDLFS